MPRTASNPNPDPDRSPLVEIKRQRRRTPESQEALRAALVAHATSLYREQGYDAVSVRAVTQLCGVSPMAFYGYFSSKRELIRYIWLEFFGELLDTLLAAGEGRRSPAKVIEAHVDAFIDYWDSHPQNYQMVYSFDDSHDDAATSEWAEQPVYLRLVALHRERVLACLHGRPVSEKALLLAVDVMIVKLLGYLHVTLAVGRHELADKARLRRIVVKDIVDTMGRADSL